MKLFTKTLLLAIAGAMIVFSAGCVATARRPVPSDTDTNSTGSLVVADSAASTTPTSGLAGSGNAGAFGDQSVFGVTTTGTATAQADDTLSKRTDGGTLANGQIRGITALQPVYFDFDRSAIKTSEYGKIQALKDYLAKNPTQRVLFEGYCDWRGTTEYNMALGDRRANAAKRYAISIGIPATKIETRSLGSTQATERGTEAEMSKDRRAEIVILVK